MPAPKKDKSDPESVFDKIKDWQDYVKWPGIKFSPSHSVYYCIEHKKLLKGGPMSNHIKLHGVEKTSQTTTDTLDALKNDANSETDFTRVQTPEEMILEDHNKEVAEAAAMLAKDYELRAEFEILHLEKKIPWDWTFYDWIKSCISSWNKLWGYVLELPQNLGVLTADQKKWLQETIQENLSHEQEATS